MKNEFIKHFDFANICTYPSIALMPNFKAIHIAHDIVSYINRKTNINNDLSIFTKQNKSEYVTSLFPNAEIVHQFTNDYIKNILERATKNVMDKNNKQMILILDNIEQNMLNELDKFNELFMNARHYHITLISVTNIPSLSPQYRINIDYMFLFRDPEINLMQLWHKCCYMLPSYENFRKVFNKCTEYDYAMVIDNRNTSTALSERIFWYKDMSRNYVSTTINLDDKDTKNEFDEFDEFSVVSDFDPSKISTESHEETKIVCQYKIDYADDSIHISYNDTDPTNYYGVMSQIIALTKSKTEYIHAINEHLRLNMSHTHNN